MARLSASQIATIAANAGVPSDQIAKSIAIALAESGGNPSAHNTRPPDNSYGLWQINMYGMLGPKRRQQYGLSSNSELFDPVVNAKAMMIISNNGRNWSPWTTYTSGAYLLHINEAKNVSPSIPVSVDSNLDTLSKLVDTLSNPGTWIRTGLLIGGFILLLVGIARITGDNRMSEATKKVIGIAVTKKVV